ncbi:hypothetical protein OC835_002997 [Tilletia horrida]|nr:hypothetical protein OC835_002997 [Tilletia horrida]
MSDALTNGGGGGGASAPAAAAQTLSYADVFAGAQPQATLPLLQTRFSNATRLHKDLVDYFAARRDLEEQYLKNLAKLVTKRALFDSADSPSAAAAGGVYATPSVQPVLDALLRELQATATIHSELEERIAKQIEAPLRALPNTHKDWSHIRELDDGLSAQIKELSSLESQLDKDRKKLSSTPSSNVKKHSQAINKVNDSQQAYDRALALWATEAPFTFEAYQRIDKSRLESITEAVIQFETAQAEAAQRLMKLSEQTTAVALGLEPGAEIRSFLRRAQNSMPKADTAPPPHTSTDSETDGSQGIIPSASMTTAGMSSTSLPSIANASGTVGDTSVSTTHSRRPPPPPGSSSGGAGGAGSTLRGALSRLGGRKARESQFGTPSNRDNANTNTVYGTLPEDDFDPNAGMRSATRTPSIFRSSRTSVDRPTTERPRTGNSLAPSGLPSLSVPGEGGNGPSSAGLMAPLVPTRAANKSSSTSLDVASQSSAAPPVDAEGFSIPPPDRKPWETGADSSSRFGDGTEDLLDSEAPPLPSRMTNLSIAGSATKSTGMVDSDRDREALERMRSTLGAPLSASSDGVARRSTTSRRERRSTRGFNPQPGLSAGLPEEGSPPSTFTAPMPGLGGPSEGRTGSMLSTTSGFGLSSPGAVSATSAARAQTQGAAVSALTSNPFEATSRDMGEAGTGTVRASITETVNAIFTGANLVRVQVVGEVQVLLSGTGSGKLNLSLGGASAINRAAPNPAFLTSAGGADHTYVLDTAALLSSGGSQGEARATVLKYQLDLPPQSSEVVPFELHAQWRCEPTQTSLMISYRPNLASKLNSQSAGPATLDDLEVLVPVAPAGSVQNVMSKPNGRWDSDASQLVWTLANSASGSETLALSAAGETSKLLARMQVDKPSVPQPVNIRWSIKGRTVSAIELAISPAADSGPDASAWSFDPSDIVRLAVSGKFMAT